MRLWTLHPKYLDVQGLGGLWRELNVAFNALTGKKKGYSNHPQLDRFKKLDNPVEGISWYALDVWIEAERRGYSYNRDLIPVVDPKIVTMPVTTEQIDFEVEHLGRKLSKRDPDRIKHIEKNCIILNSSFYAVEGDIESWERI